MEFEPTKNIEELNELFLRNFKNFKLEINRLFFAFKFDFDSTCIDVQHVVENGIGYFFFVFTTHNVIDASVEKRISMLYPHDFVSGNFLNTKQVDEISTSKSEHIVEMEGFYFKIAISSEEEELLNNLKKDLGKLLVQKYKAENKMPSSHSLEELNRKISIINNFISDIMEPKI